MGDLRKKANKFDQAVATINENEDKAYKKSDSVVKNISGKTTKKKSMPIYVPENLYYQFSKINKANGFSNNAIINLLIREYVDKNSSILEEME